MSDASDQSYQLEIFIKSLGRIQSQIQALMEMEKNWKDDLSIEQLQELIKRKQQLINNIQALIADQQLVEKELVRINGEPLSSRYQDYRNKQIAEIHQMLENVIVLHQRHEQHLKFRSQKLKDSVEEVRQALGLIRTYQHKIPQQGLQQRA